MCGIVGVLRSRGPVARPLVEGLRVLEYRGYDSAGVALWERDSIRVLKREGRLENLDAALAEAGDVQATAGIGHTRWATHGPPCDRNAHPHQVGDIALVHNGILENHEELREELESAGATFASDTDSEVLAHLLSRELEVAGVDPRDALRRVLARCRGAWACAALVPGPTGPRILATRNGPPLVVAGTADGAWLASDVLALLPHAPAVIYLEEGDVALIDASGLEIQDASGVVVERPAQATGWEPGDSSKGPWPHHMLKEMHEQPAVLTRLLRHVNLGEGDVDLGPTFADEALAEVERIQVLACGTALHAGMLARYAIERLARIPVDVDFASEFRYRDPLIAPGTMALAISQSGETADTLAATAEAAARGARVAAICNVDRSSQVRAAEAVLLTEAGPEIGVASTKAFTAQALAGLLLAVRLGRAKGTLSKEEAIAFLTELQALPAMAEDLLTAQAREEVRAVARRHVAAKGFLFLGRGADYPIALEGALKLKEISYVHAEGYAAGEMKHGPIALIDPGMTIVCLSGATELAEKMRSNVEQVRARGGVVVSVGSDAETHELASDRIELPRLHSLAAPILEVIPLQLFSYFVADLRGCDIDKPRNLAKSVTVE